MNWTQLANVVIGRPGYDNYLVAMAIRAGVNVIDATKTVLAVHISERGNNFHGSKNKDAKYNKDVIGKFKYADGYASKAGLNTVEDFLANVFIVNGKKKKNKPQNV